MLPAAHLLLSDQDIPLPVLTVATGLMVTPLVLSTMDWFLETRATAVPRALLASAAAVVVVGGVAGIMGRVLWTGIIPRIKMHPPHAIRASEALLGSTVLGAAIAGLVVGAWSLAVVFPRLVEQEKVRALQVANLELQAAEMRAQGELSRLRGQLEPHFLLNTLNLIAGLVGMDADLARRTLVNLGDLLRDTLEEHGETQTVEEEVSWLQRYCEILEARHGPDLEIEWDVHDDIRAALIPRLILQPLVENALVHGALRATRPGRILIRVFRAPGDLLLCSVEDNGPGPTGSPRRGAVGVDNVRRRLEVSCPGSLFVLDADETVTRAVIQLPCLFSTGRVQR